MTTVLYFPLILTLSFSDFSLQIPSSTFPFFVLHFLFTEKIRLQNRTPQTPTVTSIHFSASAPTYPVFLLFTYEHTMSCDPIKGHPAICAETLSPPTHTGSTSVSPCLWHNNCNQFSHPYSPISAPSLCSHNSKNIQKRSLNFILKN